jgi:hypothetical protein
LHPKRSDYGRAKTTERHKQLAKGIVDLATEKTTDMHTINAFNVHVVAVGILGGLMAGNRGRKNFQKHKEKKLVKQS